MKNNSDKNQDEKKRVRRLSDGSVYNELDASQASTPRIQDQTGQPEPLETNDSFASPFQFAKIRAIFENTSCQKEKAKSTAEISGIGINAFGDLRKSFEEGSKLRPASISLTTGESKKDLRNNGGVNALLDQKKKQNEKLEELRRGERVVNLIDKFTPQLEIPLTPFTNTVLFRVSRESAPEVGTSVKLKEEKRKDNQFNTQENSGATKIEVESDLLTNARSTSKIGDLYILRQERFSDQNKSSFQDRFTVVQDKILVGVAMKLDENERKQLTRSSSTSQNPSDLNDNKVKEKLVANFKEKFSEILQEISKELNQNQELTDDLKKFLTSDMVYKIFKVAGSKDVSGDGISGISNLARHKNPGKDREFLKKFLKENEVDELLHDDIEDRVTIISNFSADFRKKAKEKGLYSTKMLDENQEPTNGIRTSDVLDLCKPNSIQGSDKQDALKDIIHKNFGKPSKSNLSSPDHHGQDGFSGLECSSWQEVKREMLPSSSPLHPEGKMLNRLEKIPQ